LGHIENAKTNLVPLIDRLNKYPIGLVDNDILRKILTLLFDETEAYVGSKFPLHEATISELSKATGMDEDALLPVLNAMADKGLVTDMPYGDETYYMLMPGLIGFFEFTLMKNRTDLPMKELAKLMSDYFHEDPENGQAKEFFGSKTPLTRSLVYDDHIPVESRVTSYESAREIIRNASFGAVSMCYCRHKRHHEGKECKKGAPIEGTCISLGNGARFLTRRGFAEQKTTAELLDILEYTEQLKLTHITDNIRHKPTFICNCCGCCCEIMAGVQMGYYNGVAKTHYIARIDPELCDYCGECFAVCNVKAIGADKSTDRRVSAVKDEVCLGCGACVSSCEKEAISMVPRDDYVQPKSTKKLMFLSILREKKRLSPFVLDFLSAKAKKLFR
jgi:ferredoxin